MENKNSKTITLTELDEGKTTSGEEITPEMVFGDEKKVEDLPPPPGVSDQAVSNFTQPVADTKIYSYSEMVEELKSMPVVPKIPTGVEKLDSQLDGGLQGGELMVVSAATKNGKTLFAQTIAYHQAQKEIPSLFFSMEMSWQELTRKFIDMDWEVGLMKNKGTLPIFYPKETHFASIEWIEDQVIKAKREFGIKMVFIDHLHFLIPMDVARKNVSLLVGHVMRQIKQLAVKHNIPILLIAHTTKLRTDEAPDVNSPRDSSFIVQEADFLVVLWRERNQASTKPKFGKKNKTELTVEEGFQDEVFTGKTVFSVEANRRTGEGLRWAMGVVNGRFHDWETYLYIEANSGPEDEIAKRHAREAFFDNVAEKQGEINKEKDKEAEQILMEKVKAQMASDQEAIDNQIEQKTLI